VWTINYGGIPLGVGAGLTAPGVQYQASRIVAAACEGVFHVLRAAPGDLRTPADTRTATLLSYTAARFAELLALEEAAWNWHHNPISRPSPPGVRARQTAVSR